MATKTISLELDAYEKLRTAKRGNESFSAVVRRLRFDDDMCTGGQILHELEDLYRVGSPVDPGVLVFWDKATKEDLEDRRVSSSHWDE